MVHKPQIDNAVMASFVIDLGHYTNDDAYSAIAERAPRTAGGLKQVRLEGRMLGEYALALEKLTTEHLVFSIVSTDRGAAARALFSAAVDVFESRKIPRFGAPGKYPDPGHAALFACTRSLCSNSGDQSCAGQRGSYRFPGKGAASRCPVDGE